MMVMTSVSERPVTEPAGTIGALVCARLVAARSGAARVAPPPAWAAVACVCSSACRGRA